MVTDRANTAIDNIQKIAQGLSIDIFTFDLGGSKGQGHIQFYRQYLANGDRSGTHCYCQHTESRMWANNYRI